MGGIEGLRGEYHLVGCEGHCKLIRVDDLWMELDDSDLVVWRHEKQGRKAIELSRIRRLNHSDMATEIPYHVPYRSR